MGCKCFGRLTHLKGRMINAPLITPPQLNITTSGKADFVLDQIVQMCLMLWPVNVLVHLSSIDLHFTSCL